MRLLSVASALCLASASASAWASPLRSRADGGEGGDVVTLTTTQYENMKYYVQYATSAYCNSQDAVGAQVDCGDEGCPDVTANGATIVGVLPNNTVFDLEGYVAVDTVREEIVVAFRGSADWRNWVADFDFVLAPYTGAGCAGCWVHDGFLASWGEVRSRVLQLVEDAYAAHPGYALVLAGHSLGAGVGTLAAADLRLAGRPCDLYTAGSPRVGNLAFAQFVTAQAGGAEYRATHFDDPVPRLPPLVLGYRHTAAEYWLAAGPADRVDYALADVATCAGFANTSCNAGTGGLDAEAHSYYFQYLGCGRDEDDLVDVDVVGTARATGAQGMTDEELAEKLTDYTRQDIEYSRQLQANETAQWRYL